MKAMRLVLALAALLAAPFASAEMLYWMIGDASNGGSNTIEFNYAIVYATRGDEKIALPNDGRGGEIYGSRDLTPITTTGPNQTEFGEGFAWKNYSFYVELLSWDGANESIVGVSEWATYDALVSHGAIIPSGLGIPPTAHVWMPAISAPEPTSGLLFLCGWAALLLRRRRESL